VLGEEFDPEPRWREKLEKEKNKMRKSKGGGGNTRRIRLSKVRIKSFHKAFLGLGKRGKIEP
jgi:hypothetical protein